MGSVLSVRSGLKSWALRVNGLSELSFITREDEMLPRRRPYPSSPSEVARLRSLCFREQLPRSDILPFATGEPIVSPRPDAIPQA
jgi:hypothetical protein